MKSTIKLTEFPLEDFGNSINYLVDCLQETAKRKLHVIDAEIIEKINGIGDDKTYSYYTNCRILVQQ